MLGDERRGLARLLELRGDAPERRRDPGPPEGAGWAATPPQPADQGGVGWAAPTTPAAAQPATPSAAEGYSGWVPPAGTPDAPPAPAVAVPLWRRLPIGWLLVGVIVAAGRRRRLPVQRQPLVDR